VASAVTIRAALLPAVGTRLRVVDLELDPPGPGEVRVRLHASGVCSDDLNAFDGSIEVPCPLVLGHEGAGVVEEVGEGVEALRVGDHVALSWAPYCGHCEECLRDLPHLCGTAWPKMLAGGLLDGTTRLRFGGATVHHYCFLSSFAERAVVPERSCVRIPPDVPFDVAALVGCAVASGVCAVWRTAGVRPGERVAVFGLGGTGLAAIVGAAAAGASDIVAVDSQEGRLERARELGATATVRWQGSPADVAAAVRDASRGGVDYAFEARGRPAAAEAAFMSTRVRGAAVLCGIPRADATITLPALSIPRMERRVLGSIYGSARPDRDFPLILDLHRRGHLPLDRLISHRLPLAEADAAMDLVRSGDATRVILDCE
jgi:S-(hydroxymethyl)glutathione dehydrogenase / alcohol dehydrogenase